MTAVAPPPLGWGGIARLGLVQAALGAIVVLASSLLNRVMVVEYAMPASLPAGLVALHYVVQLSRPKWGHGSDRGARRTPWIVGGMAVLAAGGILATLATTLLAASPGLAIALAVAAYVMIGLGVGACGTSLLALLATRTAPERRAAAASLTWILMIAGIVVAAGVAGALLDPFSPQRLLAVAAGLGGTALAITIAAVRGVEGRGTAAAPATPDPAAADPAADPAAAPGFAAALAAIWADPHARSFTIFVFVAMVAYSAQDLILEPFAGLRFGLTPGQSTQLSSVQHMGVLAGMLLVGVGGNAFAGTAGGVRLKPWIVGGCLASAVALALLALAAQAGPGWPLRPTVFGLGLANGVFAVAAIGAMMELAGASGPGSEGIRMGLWGAAQALAFAVGGFAGATGVDAGRRLAGADAPAFATVFIVEAALFVVAAVIAGRLAAPATRRDFREVLA